MKHISYSCSSLGSPGSKPCLIPADLVAGDQSPEQAAVNKVPREYLRCVFTPSLTSPPSKPAHAPDSNSKPKAKLAPKVLIQNHFFLLLLCLVNIALNHHSADSVELMEKEKLFYVMLRAKACVGRQTEGPITSQILNHFFLLLPVLHRAATKSLLIFFPLKRVCLSASEVRRI